MSKINVMVVDDSAVVRNVFADIFSSVPDIDLVAAVPDPIFAMKRMEMQWPDVILLDIEMPRMDGITFLKKIMHEHPTPVIICSTLTEAGAETTMSAMAAGAVDIITKPKIDLKNGLTEKKSEILDIIRASAAAKLGRRPVSVADLPSRPKLNADAIMPAPTKAMSKTTETVVAIGTSTGGTQALEHVLTQLPRVSPGIVVVQHMPEKFTQAFANRLNGLCEVEVREAVNGDTVIPGRVLISPGGSHMTLNRSGAQYFVEIKDGPLVSRHKPSVDVLFRSVAKAAGKNALGIIMTGMGDDGANGMVEMHDQGASTIAEDESTCVVFGMPKEAIKRGAVDMVLPLSSIPAEIIKRRAN